MNQVEQSDPYGRLRRQQQYLHIINDFALGLLRINTVDDILWLIAKHAIAQLDFLDCVIYLVNDAGDTLVQRAAHGPKNPQDKDILAPITIKLGQGIVGTVALTGKPERITDTRNDPRYVVDDDIRLSELAVPIYYQDRVIGVIDSEHPEPNFYQPEHLEILTTIGAMASTSIATALAVERLKHTVSALNEAQRELEIQAHQDSLTGLLNRRAFDRLLEQALFNAQYKDRPCVVAFIDVDMLKTVNELCGHLAGDELLRQLARMFKLILQPVDQLARIGGDEFLILLVDKTLNQAKQTMEALRSQVEQFRFVWNNQPIHVGVSIGIAMVDEHCPDSIVAYQRADAAMLMAKQAGRNRIHVYCEDFAQAKRYHEDSHWVQRVSKEIDADNFALYFQPIVPIQSTKTSPPRCFEILLRLIEEDGQVILPGAFLPAVERYGLSARLDRYVFCKTRAWLQQNQAQLPKQFQFTINLSAYSLDDPNFIELVEDALQLPDLPERWLCLEITETAAISNFSRAVETIQRLNQLGCLFALDDFGSGITTVHYLRELPVDVVKIDGSLIQRLEDDKINQHLVKAYTEITHLLGRKIVAEFIEDETTLHMLQNIGVDFAQGYLFAKPEPITQLLKTI